MSEFSVTQITGSGMQLIRASDVRIEPDSKLMALSAQRRDELRQAMATFVNGEYNGVRENDPERVKAVAVIRAAYRESGQFEDQLCDTKTCLNFAEVTVSWPVPPGERYPRYCQSCGEWAVKVLESMGYAGFQTPFENPALKSGFDSPFGKRSINLDR